MFLPFEWYPNSSIMGGNLEETYYDKKGCRRQAPDMSFSSCVLGLLEACLLEGFWIWRPTPHSFLGAKTTWNWQTNETVRDIAWLYILVVLHP